MRPKGTNFNPKTKKAGPYSWLRLFSVSEVPEVYCLACLDSVEYIQPVRFSS